MMRNRTGLLAAAAMALLLSACGAGNADEAADRAGTQGEVGSGIFSEGNTERYSGDTQDVGETASGSLTVSGSRQPGTPLSWETAEAILEKIHDPVFPDLKVDVTDYGAVPDDGGLDTKAIQAAIDQVSSQGGGMVVVPEGVFDTGAIVLKENVNLHLESENTVLCFTREIIPENYPLVLSYYEGSPCYNWSPLIYAYEQDNIAVTGKGRLDGQADQDTWWSWYGDTYIGQDYTRPSSSDVGILRRMTDDGVEVRKRVFGEGHFLRPNFIQVIGCDNVLVEGITIKNSPMWGVNPVLCTNVTVRGIEVIGKFNNNDGCNPENCSYVLIEDCRFFVGGDGVAVKSGRNRDGWELKEMGRPAENMVIRGNEFAEGASGIAFGSEMSGDIREIYADDNRFGTQSLDYAVRFKSNAARGGVVERVYIRGSRASNIRYVPIHATMLYDEGWLGSYLPEYRDIRIEDFTASGGVYGIFMESFDQAPITGLELVDVDIRDVDHEVRIRNWKEPVLERVSINGHTYPRPVDIRAEGSFMAGETVRAAGELPGGDIDGLTYEWSLMAELGAGAVRSESESAVCAGRSSLLRITDDMEGKYLVLTARDPVGNEASSMAYRILTKDETGRFGDKAVQAALSRGYVDDGWLSLDKSVTKKECKRILTGFWGREAGKILQILEEQGIRMDTEEMVARDEMGRIALLACGIPYEELMIVRPDYKDAGDIRPDCRSSVGVSSYLGFVRAKDGEYYRPEDLLTQQELIECVMAISEFNRR
ncbi:glycoside hydrolase family 28 protein [Clostridium sp. AN503]|uniref:glycoside hydrolase family 28 protein n=1 Tax=Clostridium sp. AN503 TaxID=3160598 RepID=UPI00345A7279